MVFQGKQNHISTSWNLKSKDPGKAISFSLAPLMGVTGKYAALRPGQNLRSPWSLSFPQHPLPHCAQWTEIRDTDLVQLLSDLGQIA